MQVPGLVENFDGGFIPFHLREETGWRPDLDELAAALAAGAGFILITNPNNPTGVALTSDEMDDIVSLADRHGAWILRTRCTGGPKWGQTPSPASGGRYDRVLVTNSLSKAYGLPG